MKVIGKNVKFGVLNANDLRRFEMATKEVSEQTDAIIHDKTSSLTDRIDAANKLICKNIDVICGEGFSAEAIKDNGDFEEVAGVWRALVEAISKEVADKAKNIRI